MINTSDFNKKSIFAWCLYDWANSVLSTIIFTFIFSVYFARSIVGDEKLASAYWGYAVAFAGFIIAILSPILGAFSDIYGPRKKLLGLLTLITIISTTALFWAMPNPTYIIYALALIIIATIGFELAQAQYNAMINDIAPPNMLGRISGWAWAMGYFGGLFCLIIALFGFIGLSDGDGFFGISTEQSMNVRATCLLAAVWYLIFAIPLFLFVPDRAKNKLKAHNIPHSIVKNMSKTIRGLLSTSSNIGCFLLSSALYRDGLNTLFTVGGLYAAGTLGMNFQEILIFAIGLNITSGIGAIIFSYLDDTHGAKKTIIISLCALIILGAGIILVNDKIHFIILALLLGLFIGPAQSSGRTMMARLSPKGLETELFGFYSMTGKAISFLGPLAFGLLTHITDSQRWGMSSIIILWILGLILLLKVKEDRQ